MSKSKQSQKNKSSAKNQATDQVRYSSPDKRPRQDGPGGN